MTTQITSRIKNFTDVLQYQKKNRTLFLLTNLFLTKDEKAYRKLKLIVKTLNEGWQPDWNDENQLKYYPYFRMDNGFSLGNCGSGYRYSGVGSRLCFKSRELALYAGEQFLDTYRDYMN